MAIINGLSGSVNTDNTSQSAASGAKLKEDLNRFLTLLTTQLQHQDPLDPMNATEFTSQLVQFASVEQQIYQNSNLEKILAAQETQNLSNLVNFIDTTVEANGSKGLVLENGSAKATYNLPNGTRSATITITDSTGAQVYTADAPTDPGVHPFSWDGTMNNGQTAPDGLYTLQVNAFGSSNELLDVPQTTFGRVTGAGVVDGKATLFMGPLRVDESDILSVQEPTTTASTTQ